MPDQNDRIRETSIENTDGGLSKDNGQHGSTVRTGQNYQTHLNIIAMLATRNNSERCMYRISKNLCGYLDKIGRASCRERV